MSTLLVAGVNRIEITFHSNSAAAVAAAETFPFELSWLRDNCSIAHTNHLRKTACHADWDSNIALLPLGIYGDVRLPRSDVCRLDDVKVVQRHEAESVHVENTGFVYGFAIGLPWYAKRRSSKYGVCRRMRVLHCSDNELIGALDWFEVTRTNRDKWFSFTWDNDLFVGSDGGYTNGIYLSWYDASGRTNDHQLSVPWYYRLQTDLVGNGKIVISVRTHNVGQTMATPTPTPTPTDIEKAPPDENDTPYAGLLFWQGSVAVNRGQRTDYSTLYLGVVGPASLTEQSQKIVHKATGSTVPRGWDYQVKNEPLVALHYGRLWQNYQTKLGPLEYDVVTGMQGGLGNVRSSVDASAFLRVGSQLNTSYSVLALVSQREINPTAHSGGWFAYVGTSIQYAFNNIILDGNTFRDSPSVSWKHGAGTISLGAATSTKNWGYSISNTDFAVSDTDDIGKHAFGSISILHRLR